MTVQAVQTIKPVLMTGQAELHGRKFLFSRLSDGVRLSVAVQAFHLPAFQFGVLLVRILHVSMDGIIGEGLRLLREMAELAFSGVESILMTHQAVRHFRQHAIVLHTIGSHRGMAEGAVERYFGGMQFMVKNVGMG